MKKAGQLVKGSAFGMAEFFVTALLAIALTPFIINSLGDTMYGMWIFVGSFLGYYGLMDFGLGSAVQRFLSRAIGARDIQGRNKIINTALALFSLIGLLTLAASAGVAFGIPLVLTNITDVQAFRHIILILGINFAIGFPLRVFSGILFANVRFDINSKVQIIKTVLRSALIVVFLRMGYGIIALALITFFTDICAYGFRVYIVRRLFSDISFSMKLIDRSLIKPMFGYSIYTFIAQISDQLRFNVDNLVITAFIGLSAVTVYSIAAKLIRYFMSFSLSAIGLLTPMFSQYEAAGDYEKIKEKFIFTTKISSYFAILVGGIMIIFGKEFIQAWVGERFEFSYNILLILIVPTVISLMQTPSVQLLYGISKHKFFAMSNGAEGLANLALSLILVRSMGVTGIALGTAIPMIVVKIFIQPVYTCRCIGLKLSKYYLSVLMPAVLNSSAVLLVFWLGSKNFIAADYLNLAALISLLIVFFTVAVFFLGFKYVERGYVRKVLYSLQGRQPG